MKLHLHIIKWLFLGIKWFIMGLTGMLIFVGATGVVLWTTLQIVASQYIWYVLGIFALIGLGYLVDISEEVEEVVEDVFETVFEDIKTELNDYGFETE